MAALQVLADVGMLLHESSARELLLQHGAEVEGELVRIPEHLVKQARLTAPRRFTVSGRHPGKDLSIEPNRVYYGPGPTCPYILDPYTGARREFTSADAVRVAQVCDALDHIDFLESLGSISDAPGGLMDTYEFYLLAQHTSKPVVAWSFDRDSCEDIYWMGVEMAGSKRQFRHQPSYIFYAEPISPLRCSENAMQKLMFCAENWVPLVFTPAPVGGATAPATMAGVLVQGLAECLAGLTVAQLISPGCPLIMGGVATIMDMRTMVMAYGAPELSLLSAAYTEILRMLDLPMWSTGGCSDSHAVDEQAAVEATLSLLSAGISGANLVHDLGFLESAMTSSLEMLVMCDEIIGMVKRVLQGLPTDPATLAAEVIDAVGPGGKFLAEEQTVASFRRECYFPQSADRHNFAQWQRLGSQTMGDRLRARVHQIIESPPPEPLSSSNRQRFDEILEQALARRAEVA
jgi:trimethylamine--corrinoid protein Co-methyltransferase